MDFLRIVETRKLSFPSLSLYWKVAQYDAIHSQDYNLLHLALVVQESYEAKRGALADFYFLCQQLSIFCFGFTIQIR